jgi:hypothetical protein
MKEVLTVPSLPACPKAQLSFDQVVLSSNYITELKLKVRSDAIRDSKKRLSKDIFSDHRSSESKIPSTISQSNSNNLSRRNKYDSFLQTLKRDSCAVEPERKDERIELDQHQVEDRNQNHRNVYENWRNHLMKKRKILKSESLT